MHRFSVLSPAFSTNTFNDNPIQGYTLHFERMGGQDIQRWLGVHYRRRERHEHQKQRFTKRTVSCLYKNLAGKKLAMLGFAFKKDKFLGPHGEGRKDCVGLNKVTSLSLTLTASPSTMTIRMKEKYNLGATANDCKTYNPHQEIVEGCVAPAQRHFMNEHWANWANWSKEDQKAEFAKLKKIMIGHGVAPPVVFQTNLVHADYIVMHGDDPFKIDNEQIEYVLTKGEEEAGLR